MGSLRKNEQMEYYSVSSAGEEGGGAIRRVVSNSCRTVEMEEEAGKFITKCEKTTGIFKDCVGRSPELKEIRHLITEKVAELKEVKDIDAIERRTFF